MYVYNQNRLQGTCENLYLFVMYVYNQNRLQGTSENLYLFVMYVYNQNRLQGTSENLYLFVMYAYNQNRELQGLKIPQVRRPGLENWNFGLAVFPWKKPVGHAFNKIKTPHFSKRLVFNSNHMQVFVNRLLSTKKLF